MKNLWDDDSNRGWFSYLSPNEQWAIHQFFQISKNMSDQQLLAQRAAITNQRPSLPGQAGKAAAHLDRLIVYGPIADPAYQRQLARERKKSPVIIGRPRRLVIRSEVKPEIDAKQVARAIIRIAQTPRQQSLPDSGASTPQPSSSPSAPRLRPSSSPPRGAGEAPPPAQD